MSEPYLIWTMRRTGGTTLASLLASLSEHPKIEHEPFNHDRALGHVFLRFKETGDEAMLRAMLRECLGARPLIKHCHELKPAAFNLALLQVACSLGYRQVVLDRRNEIDRILSLELAALTGAWGGAEARRIYPAIEAGTQTLPAMDLPRLLREMTHCHLRRRELAEMMRQIGAAPFVVYFEDIYAEHAQGRALIERLLAFLGIDPAEHEGYERLVEEALLRRGQNSARIMDAVPNLAEMKAEMARHEAECRPVFEAS
ncbi:hypothetical protein [Roseovarius aquimarinus]|uniref:Stf0 sulfotransferase n=1 Tax=Roseovarius aquimarinus TaxID=1229156 RepID=A0ABW7IAE7_9RHOB